MKIALLSALLALSSYTLACPEKLRLKNHNACVNVHWNYGPFLNQYNEALVTLSALDETKPMATNEIKIFPWMIMQHHEHGSRPVIQTKLRDNEYKVEKIYFMGGMQGIWQLRIQNTNSGKVTEEVRYDVTF